ncbi:hypothetical protein BDR03DRAFT_429373 [Suillus americanus]|nr:hypothetical protein BDR03DRAFT_429373 [Suillus americanus]
MSGSRCCLSTPPLSQRLVMHTVIAISLYTPTNTYDVQMHASAPQRALPVTSSLARYSSGCLPGHCNTRCLLIDLVLGACNTGEVSPPRCLHRIVVSFFLLQALVYSNTITGQCGNTGVIFPQPDHRALVPTEEAESVWIEGAPSMLIEYELKILASVSEVAPERIPGYQYSRSGAPLKPNQSPTKNYFFHVGGFPHVSAHPQDLCEYYTKSYRT